MRPPLGGDEREPPRRGASLRRTLATIRGVRHDPTDYPRHFAHPPPRPQSPTTCTPPPPRTPPPRPQSPPTVHTATHAPTTPTIAAHPAYRHLPSLRLQSPPTSHARLRTSPTAHRHSRLYPPPRYIPYLWHGECVLLHFLFV